MQPSQFFSRTKGILSALIAVLMSAMLFAGCATVERGNDAQPSDHREHQHHH